MPAGTRCYIQQMSDEHLIDIDLKLAQTRQATAEAVQAAAEALLTAKKARWYELVIFGGGGITVGVGIAQLFLR